MEPSRNQVTRRPKKAERSTRFVKYAKQCKRRNQGLVPRNQIKSEEGPRRLLIFARSLPSIKILLLEQGEPHVRCSNNRILRGGPAQPGHVVFRGRPPGDAGHAAPGDVVGVPQGRYAGACHAPGRLSCPKV